MYSPPLKGTVYILIDACLTVNKVLASAWSSAVMGSLQSSTARSARAVGRSYDRAIMAQGFSTYCSYTSAPVAIG
ncbi:hypothetical protein QT971_26785 [Microcoleus sp. herbarium19]|uniref:hypothetical protein n=1 Tax=unclassified Microcoleus TaxID=2642155 RepID=UPI002FD32F1D